MGLVPCPECLLQVSTKAITCPHCGYPLDAKCTRRAKAKLTKHKRLPNGFGSITCLGKHRNLRNPYWARVCTGQDELGRYILKPLKPQAYFATYNDAYEALVDYNRNPYDLNDDITVEQLYEKWSAVYFAACAPSVQKNISSVWIYCSSIAKMRAKDVRGRHIKGVMDDGYRIEFRGKHKGEKVYPTAGTKARIKSMFNLMFDYALEFEIVTTNPARTFDVSAQIVKDCAAAKRQHFPFNDTELQILWDNLGVVKFVDWVLIQCYMGWRPQELAKLELAEVNLDEWYMQAGMKTDAGRQRIVPIHTRIRPLVQRNYDYALSIGSKYLFNDKGQTHSGNWAITYDKYAKRFNKVIEALQLNPEHRPHDPRNTFITNSKKVEMDEYAIKAMVGHTVQDITESVYTLRDVEWLRKDLEKLS